MSLCVSAYRVPMGTARAGRLCVPPKLGTVTVIADAMGWATLPHVSLDIVADAVAVVVVGVVVVGSLSVVFAAHALSASAMVAVDESPGEAASGTRTNATRDMSRNDSG
nr:hypothetical protein [Pandoravirus massiliensis]